MSFLCATFFNISKLPDLARGLIELLPLTHCTYALRAIGGGGDAPLASWVNLILYVLLMIGASVWTMERVRR
jgi:ABC-type polysaccharide/polyol phosphate export permease